MPMADKRPDIKIFVSRRIDVDSVTVDNPLYLPVRCGAVYGGDPAIQGDNTGDNISQKRDSFCEFTVQYWAWKNVKADYYGLCHYRRYLSFGGQEYRADDHGLVPCAVLSSATMKRFGLLDGSTMAAEIAQYDLVIPRPATVERMPLPHGRARTVRQLWEARDGIFFEKKVIDRMFSLIEELAPEFSASAREYFNGGLHRGYNCYVMRRELFDRLCRLQFPIMEALERELNTTGDPDKLRRTPAYIGEMLFGIFLHHIINHENWRVNQRQLVWFSETRAVSGGGLVRCYITYGLDRMVRAVAAPFFPLGSKRREVCKAIYYRLTRAGRKWNSKYKVRREGYMKKSKTFGPQESTLFEPKIDKERYMQLYVRQDCFAKFADVKSILQYGNVENVQKPFISFVVPTFMREDLLEETLISILRQPDLVPYDVIVVDNSEDISENNKTYQLIKRLKSNKILYYVNEKNLGQAGNWNRCFSVARGKYVAMVHDDDLIVDDYLEQMLKCLTVAESFAKPVGLIRTLLADFSDSKCLPILNNRNQGGIRRFFRINALAIDGIGPSSCPTGGMLFNRKAVIEAGGFNPDFYPSHDYVLGYVLMRNGYNAFTTEDQLGYYRIGENAAMQKSVLKKFCQCDYFFREFLYSENLFSRLFGALFRNVQYSLSVEGMCYSAKLRFGQEMTIDEVIFCDGYGTYNMRRKLYFKQRNLLCKIVSKKYIF